MNTQGENGMPLMFHDESEKEQLIAVNRFNSYRAYSLSMVCKNRQFDTYVRFFHLFFMFCIVYHMTAAYQALLVDKFPFLAPVFNVMSMFPFELLIIGFFLYIFARAYPSAASTIGMIAGWSTTNYSVLNGSFISIAERRRTSNDMYNWEVTYKDENGDSRKAFVHNNNMTMFGNMRTGSALKIVRVYGFNSKPMDFAFASVLFDTDESTRDFPLDFKVKTRRH